MIDLIIRQARVLDSTRDLIADIAVQNGKIVEVKSAISDDSPVEIDANGLLLIPGGIDPHVHFNEPGRAEWEGLKTGSQALAKGGMTSFFDMPLNSTPPVLSAEEYHKKRRLADEKSLVNAYLWGGLTPDNLDELDSLADCGVIGFKAFMSNSGIDDFKAVDDYALYKGMEVAAKHGLIVAVHAENDAITSHLAQQAMSEKHLSVPDYLQSRPVIAELEAIQRAILFTQETGCKLHIVHVSSGRGIELVKEAQAKGIDVTCETCPHYLALTDEDVAKIGAVAKCAPPIRSQEEQNALWDKLIAGDIDIVASDHSPAPMSLKQGDNFFSIWGGISGCQSTLPLLLTEGYHNRGMSLQQIVAVTSTNTAQHFGLNTKGTIAVDMDADLTLIDLETEYVLNTEDLAYQHKVSPYVGMQMRGEILKTWVGGKLVYG